MSLERIDLGDLYRALAAATRGDWMLEHNKDKEPLVRSSVGMTVIPANPLISSDDLRAIVAMQRVIMPLVSALNIANAERDAAIEALERAQNSHAETLRRTQEHIDTGNREMEQVRALLAELEPLERRHSRELEELRLKVDRMTPVMEGVESWAKTRYAPKLLAIFDRYREQCTKH